MADPLTIIGSVAAISQLTSGLVKLTTDLRQHAKDIHKAPEELEFFLLETSNFTGLLNYFTEVADRSSQEAGRKLKKREGLICQIKEQCKYVSDGIENLVRRFGKLAHGNTAPFQTLLERIKWLLDKPDVKTLRLSLQMAMITVNSLTTLFMWEEAIVKNIVNERTKMFEQQLRNWQPMAKKAMKELRKHEQKHEKTQDLRTSNSNHAMLVTSEEIRRRIASVIETHAQPGVGPKRRFRTNREGPQEYMQTPKPVTVPKPRLSSVSPASSASTGSRSSTIARPRDEESSSSEKQVITNELNDRRRSSKPSPQSPTNYFALDIDDPMRPRIIPIHEEGPWSERASSSSDKTSDEDHRPRGLVPYLGTREDSGNSVENSRGIARSPKEERVQLSPCTSRPGDEGSQTSDGDDDNESFVSERSALQASSPSSVQERDRHPWGPLSLLSSTAGCRASEVPRLRSADDWVPRSKADRSITSTARLPNADNRNLDKLKQQPLSEQEQQHRHQHRLVSSQEGRQRLAPPTERIPSEERREHLADKSEFPGNRDESLREERPHPHVLRPPIGGISGRRRPRRPRPKAS